MKLQEAKKSACRTAVIHQAMEWYLKLRREGNKPPEGMLELYNSCKAYFDTYTFRFTHGSN
jgi:hypothetical protein